MLADSWTKVTVVLGNRQRDFLDELALDLRRKTGRAASRAEIIRTLVNGVEESGISLDGIRSQAELADLLRDRIKGRSGRG